MRKLKQATLYSTLCTIQHKVCIYGFCNMSFNLEPNLSYVYQITTYIVVLDGDLTDYSWLLRAWWDDVHPADDRIITRGLLYYIIQIQKYKIKHLTWWPHSPTCPADSDLTPSEEANSISGSQNNHIVWSPMVHYHVHRSDTCPYPVPNRSSLQRPILFL